MKTDFYGYQITENESLDKVIDVWEIEPSGILDCDTLIIRSYQVACQQAQEILIGLMDNHDFDEDGPIIIKISKLQMTVEQLREMDE